MPVRKVGTGSSPDRRYSTTVEPLVGRDVPLAAADAAISGAARGSGALVLVSGDAGIGKSRLVQEITQRAVSRGMTARMDSRSTIPARSRSGPGVGRCETYPMCWPHWTTSRPTQMRDASQCSSRSPTDCCAR